MFDIVIPVGPNDIDIIIKQIPYTKRNILNYRNIYLVTNDKSLNIEGCITIDEQIFPFTLETVSTYHGKLDRNGWFLQQLLKLYSGLVIPDILDKYLVVDSDTFFLKETSFIQNGKCLYNYGTEYHLPYFSHITRLDKSIYRIIPDKSGICHHMMFETRYLKEMFEKIEQIHNDKFYNIFLNEVEPKEYLHSGASEYELYFNYMLLYHPEEIIIRELNWQNVNTLNLDSKFDYISYHWYSR
jgi:hypothetical protein